MAVPTVYPTAMFDKLDEFMLEFLEHDQEISAGVASFGDAAAYAEVWEWGNVRQTKPGPKTVLGQNPNGEQVWLSIQAPFGYIKINENQYWEVLKEELGKVQFKSTNARGITEELEKAAEKAMKIVAQIIGDHAPVDTEQLSKSFKVVKAGDPMLDDSDDTRLLTIGQAEE
jgi:bacteriophage HK97-gp10 putative tail-component